MRHAGHHHTVLHVPTLRGDRVQCNELSAGSGGGPVSGLPRLDALSAAGLIAALGVDRYTAWVGEESFGTAS